MPAIQLLLHACLWAFLLTGCSMPPASSLQEPSASPNLNEQVIRVRVTSQSYNFTQPWQKRPPLTREGIGAIIEGGRILVTAQLVADATFIEVIHPDSNEKTPAKVEFIDYRPNLALLLPESPGFFKGKKGMKIGQHLRQGEMIHICLIEENGMDRCLDGTVRKSEVIPYPSTGRFLSHQIETVLPRMAPATSLPLIKDGRLQGLSMEYDHETSMLTALSAEVINHFLQDLQDKQYDGFPVAGLSIAPLDDLPLRDFLGLSDSRNGAYIYKVLPQGPCALAGLKKGDVLMGINEFIVDKEIKYPDPTYGRLDISHLTSTLSQSHDFLTFHIIRDKEEKEIEVKLFSIPEESYPIPPIWRDRPPKYMVVGGLVLIELTREYLQEWGDDWQSRAPRELVYYYNHQWELLPSGKKVIILSEVIPTRAMVGYSDIRGRILESVNGRELTRLEDIGEAMNHPINGYHQFKLLKSAEKIYLSNQTIEQEDRFIREHYGIDDEMTVSHLPE